jgi:hypothetical protein
MKTIELYASHTYRQVINRDRDLQCTFGENYFDSIKEAKARLKRIMSEDYRISSEMSEPIRYGQIVVNGECVYDCFAKGYNGGEEGEEKECASAT